MADETLGLEIKYTLDTSELIAGSEAANAALQETAKTMENTGTTFKEGAEDIEQAVDEMSDEVQEKAREAGDALAETGKKARQAGQDTGDGASKGIKGLDELKDSAGDTSSSLGAMGGAISVLNPEMGAMVSNAGALSGGLEGAAKMTGGFRAAIGALSSPVGLVAVGVLAAGAALFAWSKRARGAQIDTEELEGAIEALDAAQKRFMSTKIELSVLRGETTALRAELDNLSSTIEDEFADAVKEANDPFADFNQDVADAQAEVNELTAEYNKNVKAAQEAGGATGGLRHEIIESQKAMTVARHTLHKATQAQQAAINGDSEAAKVRRELLAGIEKEEAARRQILEIRIQQETESKRQSKLLRAQADNDTEAIRQVSMEMAIQGDISMQAAMQMLNYGASMAKAALAATGLLGPALQASMAAIDAQLQATKERILVDTRYNSILQDNLKGMTKNIEATQSQADAETNLAETQKVAADMLAMARGEIATINHEHLKQLEQIAEMAKQGALTESEAAELVTAADREKKKAIDEHLAAKHAELQETHDLHRASVVLAQSETDQLRDEHAAQLAAAQEAYDKGFASKEEFTAKKLELDEEYRRKKGAIDAAQLQSDLANAQMVTDQIGSLMDAAIAQRTEQIDQEEAAALARAAGNMEEQEKIRQKFDNKRRAELAKAFRARQALEISNALISGASAAIAALAPPPVGAGPVLGPFLAGMIATTTGLKVATISQQKPSFHQGGIVGGDGDQMITAQGGEVVLNRNAVAELGGTSAANSLNSGGAAGGVVVVQMTYRNKMFDQLVVDNLAKGGPLKKALGRATRRGRRGRVGGRL